MKPNCHLDRSQNQRKCAKKHTLWPCLNLRLSSLMSCACCYSASTTGSASLCQLRFSTVVLKLCMPPLLLRRSQIPIPTQKSSSRICFNNTPLNSMPCGDFSKLVGTKFVSMKCRLFMRKRTNSSNMCVKLKNRPRKQQQILSRKRKNKRARRITTSNRTLRTNKLS